MKQTTVISAVAVALILAGAVWFSRTGTRSSASGAVASLVVEERDYDFGTIAMAAGNVRHTFRVRNAGGEPVEIKKLSTSCMCTTATAVFGNERFGPFGMPGHGFIPRIGKRVAPGEEFGIDVVFDPAAHGPAGVGRIAREVTMETNGGTLAVSFVATVTP